MRSTHRYLFAAAILSARPVLSAGGDPLLLPQTLLTLSANSTTDTHAIPVTVGNQRLNLVVSTTSSRSWLYSTEICGSLPEDSAARSICEVVAGVAADDQAGGLYDMSNSGGNSKFNQISDDFQYRGPNTGINLKGVYASDTLKIGDTVLEGMEFGIVTSAGVNRNSDDEEEVENPQELSTSMFGTFGISGGVGGVLGLGGDSVLLKKLIEAKIIAANGIGVQVGAKIFFTDEENVNTYPNRRIVPADTPDNLEYPGSIILGGYDAAKVGTDAFGDSEGGSDSGKASALTEDGEIPFTLTMMYQTWFDGVNDFIRNDTEFDARADRQNVVPVVVDSTSPLILFPQTFWDKYLDDGWNRARMDAATGRAQYVDVTGYRDWRNFTFVLEGADGNVKELTLQHFDWNAWDEEAGFWAPTFGLTPGDKFVIGRPGLRALYAAVDWEQKRAATKEIVKRDTVDIQIERTSAAVRKEAGVGVAFAMGIMVMIAVGVF